MKTGRTLTELAVELDRQRSAKRDFVVTNESTIMEESAELFTIIKPLESGMQDCTPFNMTELFHRQLGGALQIPAKYYDRMRVDSPELLAWNVNWWLRSDGIKEKRQMIRTFDGTARAFLSDRYRRIDNYDVANAVLPIVSEMPEAQVMSCEVTDHRLYLKIVNPRLENEVVPGDVVQAGVVISNSEVGLGSVSVMPLIYRLVCSNGMIVNDLGQRKYHIGRVNDEQWELFSDATLQADDRAFMFKLADIVRTAVDEAKFSMVVDKLREAAQAPITGKVKTVVELTAKEFNFTENEQNDILQHLIAGGDWTLYNLSSAVTRAAQDAPDYTRATELEAAGWQIVTMPRSAWSALNAS